MSIIIRWFKKILKQIRCNHTGVVWKQERTNGPRIFRCHHCDLVRVNMFDVKVIYDYRSDGHRYDCKCDCRKRIRRCVTWL